MRAWQNHNRYRILTFTAGILAVIAGTAAIHILRSMSSGQTFGDMISDVIVKPFELMLAVSLLGALIWLATMILGWRGPVGIEGLLSEFMGRIWPKMHRTEQPLPADLELPSNNVDCLDVTGELLNLGPVPIMMRNCHGGRYFANYGVFMDCDPRFIKAGAHVVITIADFLNFRAVVGIDPRSKALYVQIPVTTQQLIARISRGV